MRTSAQVDRDIQGKYDGYYDGASRWRAIGASGKAASIKELCNDLVCSTVLEVGAGEGSVLSELQANNIGTDLFALEISESGVAAIKNRKLDRLREVRRFDGYRIPYDDKRFDLVVATHVLEHVEHERLFLQELKRVGKRVLIEVPLENTLRVAGAIDNNIGHINFYSKETVSALVRSVGFHVIRSRMFDTSLDLLIFQFGRTKGTARHLIRNLMLRASPTLASKLFVYHFAMLLES